jgi:hypothetical protein
VHLRRGVPPCAAFAAVVVIVAVAALGAAPGGAPAGTGRPPDDALRAIEDRGRYIARYVDAVAKGRAVFAREGQALAQPDDVVAIESQDGWRVVFVKDAGKLSSPGMPRQGTVIVAETDYGPDSGEIGPLRAMQPPRPAPASTVSYARAIEVAGKAAADRRQPAGPPYDSAVYREKDGTFTVYLMSKGEKESDVVFGGDLVGRVAPSGRQLVSLEPLHAQTTVVPLAGHPAAQPTLHVHPTDDLPTPTDVALVLLHAAAAPHLIMTQHSIFRVEAPGTLTYIGPNEAPRAGPGGGS